MKNGSRKALLDRLGDAHMSDIHADIQRTSNYNAGSWLLKDQSQFQSWQKTSISSLLRLRGNMGAGKSVLTSLVISHMRQFHGGDRTNGMVAYLYYSADPVYQGKRSCTKHILRELLRQLADTDEGVQLVDNWAASHSKDQLDKSSLSLILEMIKLNAAWILGHRLRSS